MAVVAINQNDVSFLAATQFMTQAGRQLKAASTTTNNNDFFLRRCQNDPLNVNQLLAKGKGIISLDNIGFEDTNSINWSQNIMQGYLVIPKLIYINFF